MLKMTLLARKGKKNDSNLQRWVWKASAFVVVLHCVCVCVPAYVSMRLPGNLNAAALQWDFEKACHNEAKLQEEISK